MIKISISNQSTQFKDADLPALANALQLQVTRDFFPAWGINAQLFYTPIGQHPPADHWVIALLDNTDSQGALGYHDVTPTGLPLGKVFVETTLRAGDSVSVCASHELLEMLVDPDINDCIEIDDATDMPSHFFAKEVCDACEADQYGYQITMPAGWLGAGTSVLVSDFVYPSWFQSFLQGVQFDFQSKITSPLTLLPGGYIGVLDLMNLSRGWQQLTEEKDPTALMNSRAHSGSRRMRRMLPRSAWIRSSYEPGREAAMSGQEHAA